MATAINKNIDSLKLQLSVLPNESGVYRFFDNQGTIIYIGKAKNLKKRVSSYFLNTKNKGRKVQALVAKIVNIEHTVVYNERDALLLENNMIKNFQPRYNILLKDDKTYPWIIVKNEQFPRILSVRKKVKDGSNYYGPYVSSYAQKNLIELVSKMYKIRSCNLALTEDGVRLGKFSKCLEYHIGNCKAPCEGFQSREEYVREVEGATEILRGNVKVAEQKLRERMMKCAEEMRFEEAQRIQKQLLLLKKHIERSMVVTTLHGELDVISLVIDSSLVYCNYLHLKDGAIVNSANYELKLRLEESREEILSFAITSINDIIEKPLSKEIIVQFIPDINIEGVVFTVPQRGDKLKVLELSEKNSRLYRLDKLKQLEKKNPALREDRLMETMRKELSLNIEPRHIECFDNSNIQGDYPVSSCVVFRNGKPSKKEYRHFNIKTVVGIDDFASMRETVLRRYSRMLEEGESLPQLIVVDGGKGQLSMSYAVLVELGLQDKIKIIGLAKRMEEIFQPNDPYPLCLDKQGETLKVLMFIRDEAHRFGITFHRNKRSAGFIKSKLEEIPTLGAKSIEKLLKKFHTVANVSKASREDLEDIVGKSRANAIIIYFETNNKR
ncbi:MAG: excinuclease ABC subunit C [Bacteroidetes bacterium]|nr:excinuclease ABC subunit C [Bacteroidota bacterium]